MSQKVQSEAEVTLDQVLTLAQQLAPPDQARLIAKLAPEVVSYVEEVTHVHQYHSSIATIW